MIAEAGCGFGLGAVMAAEPAVELASDPVSLMRFTLRSGSLGLATAADANGACAGGAWPGRTSIS